MYILPYITCDRDILQGIDFMSSLYRIKPLQEAKETTKGPAAWLAVELDWASKPFSISLSLPLLQMKASKGDFEKREEDERSGCIKW
jgi:hypothetical protein